MSKHLTIIAKLRAKPGMESRVRQVCSALTGPTRKEEGCIFYELHQSLDNPREFVFIEIWASAAHLDAHMKTRHVQAAFKTGKEILEGPVEISQWSLLV